MNTTNYRIFVEKLPRFRVEADSLRRELNANLNLSLGSLRLLNVYDLFGFTPELLEKSRYTVFGEVVTDEVTDTCDLEGHKYLAVEYLPGQFDQRAASAVDCVRLIDPSADVRIRSAKLLVFDDTVSDEELARIRHYYINAVESREKDLGRLCDMEQAGIRRGRIILDPGFGFAKTAAQNFELLAGLHRLCSLGCPVLAGLSRKSMIYRTLGCTPAESLAGTVALGWECLRQGAAILRVHDVREAADSVRLFRAFRGDTIQTTQP